VLNGFFMLGFPSETLEEMEKTVEFAINSPLHIAEFFFVMPHKGTPLYESLDEATRAAADRMLDGMYYDSPTLNLSAVSSADLALIQRRALYRFYFNPRRVWRFFKVHPRLHHAFYSFLIESASKAYFQVGGFIARRRALTH